MEKWTWEEDKQGGSRSCSWVVVAAAIVDEGCLQDEIGAGDHGRRIQMEEVRQEDGQEQP